MAEKRIPNADHAKLTVCELAARLAPSPFGGLAKAACRDALGQQKIVVYEDDKHVCINEIHPNGVEFTFCKERDKEHK